MNKLKIMSLVLLVLTFAAKANKTDKEDIAKKAYDKTVLPVAEGAKKVAHETKKVVKNAAEDVKDYHDAAKKREAAKEGVVPLVEAYAEDAVDIAKGDKTISRETATYLKLAAIGAVLVLAGYLLLLKRK